MNSKGLGPIRWGNEYLFLLTGAGGEAYPEGMQQEEGKRPTAIFAVSDDRMPAPGELYSDLVGTACLQGNEQEARRSFRRGGELEGRNPAEGLFALALGFGRACQAHSFPAVFFSFFNQHIPQGGRFLFWPDSRAPG